jgi:hypothetical protein
MRADLKNWLNLAADGVYATMILVGDAVVIHRCFLIWGRRLAIIALPVLLLLGTAGMHFPPVPLAPNGWSSHVSL